MAECQHCGSFVTEDYVRVFGDRDGQVHVCPNCEDRVRDHSKPKGYRETVMTRSSYSNGSNPSAYDPDHASAGGDA